MEASIIIPHYKDRQRLEVCLNELATQIATTEIETIVVENGPQPIEHEFQQNFPTVRFLHEPRPGAARARNKGLNHAKGGSIIFLDADCRPAPSYIENAKELFGQNAIFGGKVEIFHETNGALSGSQAFEEVCAFDQQDYIDRHNFSVTANLVTTKEVATMIGPFRHGVPEDKEWCERAQNFGIPVIYAPNLVVSHPSRATWHKLCEKWRRLCLEGFTQVKVRPFGRVQWCIQACLMPISILAHLPRFLSTSRPMSLGARLRGIATLARLRLWRGCFMLRLLATNG